MQMHRNGSLCVVDASLAACLAAQHRLVHLATLRSQLKKVPALAPDRVSRYTQVVFLDKFDTELEAADAHDQELIQRMGPAAVPHLNLRSNEAAAAKAPARLPAGRTLPSVLQSAQRQLTPLGASSSALAALAEGPAMAAAMAAVSHAGADRENIMQIAQAAAAAAAAAAGAAAAAAANLASDAAVGSKGKKKEGGVGGRRRGRAAAAGDNEDGIKPISQYKVGRCLILPGRPAMGRERAACASCANVSTDSLLSVQLGDKRCKQRPVSDASCWSFGGMGQTDY